MTSRLRHTDAVAPLDAPMPPDEDARLAALRRYEVLDSAAEAAYDDLAMLAATICEAPIALISLVDESRQWFKSRIGLDVQETSRRESFCAHTLTDGKLLEVEDARLDPRFADNALVLGDPGIVSYTGSPLVTPDGFALGTLCVIGHEPKRLTQLQKDALEALSRQVVRLIEQRRVVTALVDVTRALDEFSARTAHDLKNPVAAIRGYADILRRRNHDLDESTRQEILERLVSLAGRTTVMIDNVLLQARSGMSGVAPYCNSGAVVAQSLATADLANAEVVVDPPEEEWPDLAASVVDVHSILGNLIANADHYGRSRDGRLRLRLSADSSGSQAVFTVEDSGAGVDATIRDEVFEPFVNGPTATVINPQSSGLGLALVRRVAQLAGGDVMLDDTPVGARFVVRLPLAEPEHQPETSEQP